jgi:protein TonB
MIHFLKLFLFLIITINTATGLCQQCNQFTTTTHDDNNGENMFAFKEVIDVLVDKGKSGFKIYGFLSDSTIVLVFNVVGGGSCVKESAGINVKFADGTKLKLKNVYKTNCLQKSVLYFSKKLNTLAQLEMFMTKEIAELKVWTVPPGFVKLDFPSESASRLRESLKCLSTYFGVKPPPDTTSTVPKIKYTRPPASLRDSTRTKDTTTTYMVVEQQPEFEGGYDAMLSFVRRNLTFPAKARKEGVHGTVYVTFIVMRDGSIKEIRVLRKVHPDLDAEAVRVVKLMPKWNPGMQNGVPVNVRFNLPVTFK